MKYYLYRFHLLIVTLLLIASCSSQSPMNTAVIANHQSNSEAPAMSSMSEKKSEKIAPNQDTERLGTQWGENINSRITGVDLKRLSNVPNDVVQIHYAASIPRGSSTNEAMIANNGIGISILNDSNSKWSLIKTEGQYYFKGKKDQRYKIAYRNYTNKTFEIVATVDGLDVINGSAGSFNNNGYVLKPRDTLVIEGFRKSSSDVAAFRFSAISDAYAANTAAGSINNTGIIGTAIFELNVPQAQAFSGNNGYAPAPNNRYKY